MSCPVVIRPEAEQDMAAAIHWYEERRKGLGLEFLLEFRKILQSIEENPGRNAIIYQGVRQALARRFPYKLLYLVEGSTVEIIAVVHAKRHDSTWRKRV